jgi:drug/metabolite transporter (DMT)-like permease
MPFLPPFAIVFAAILWSLDGFLRQSLYAAPSFLIVTLEHALGALLFLPLIFAKRHEIKKFTQQTWGSLVWVSLFGGILGTFFYTKALSYVGYIDLSVVVLLQKLQPFFAILLATIVLREKLTKNFLLLALLAFIGGYMITFSDLIPQFSGAGDRMAALLAVGAAFCWGTSTVFGKQALQNSNFFLITGMRLSLTFVLALVPMISLGQMEAIGQMTQNQWLALLAIVFSTGAIALAIYYWGLKRVPASHSSLYELAWPLSALVLDAAINKTVLSITQYAGVAVLLIALVLLARMQKPAPITLE